MAAKQTMKAKLLVFVLLGATFAWPGQARAQLSSRSRMWTLALRSADAVNKGQIRNALRGFNGALASVESAEIKTAKALCFTLLGHSDKALAVLKSTAKAGATLPEVHYWTGRLLFQKGATLKACKAMDRALSLGGDRPVFLIAKALICRRAGRLGAARKAILEAASRTGDLMDPRLFPDPRAGILDLVFASLKPFPRKQKAWVTMVHLYYAGGHFKRAEALTQRILKRWGRIHEALFMKARCRLAAGDLKAALKWANKTLGSQPSDAAALALRGHIHILRDKNRRALADIERAVRRNPRNPINLTRLGHLLWNKGHYGRAERMFRYALVRAPNLASAHLGLANALDRLKKVKTAEVHFRAAIKANPANAKYRQSYAVFLQKNDKKEAAKKLLRVAKELDKVQNGFKKKITDAKKRRTQIEKVLEALKRNRLDGAAALLKGIKRPRAAVFFVQAHILSLKKKGASSKARSALGSLKPKKLLSPSARVTHLSVSGKTRAGKVSYRFIRQLHFVNPSLL